MNYLCIYQSVYTLSVSSKTIHTKNRYICSPFIQDTIDGSDFPGQAPWGCIDKQHVTPFRFSSPTGEVLDELSPRGKRSCLVVDATQSLGVVPIDVKAAGIDWLVPRIFEKQKYYHDF